MVVTIAEAAGLINVGVVVLQSTFPLILMFVLVGIAAHANTAATWSVTGRLLNGTYWPSILRTDSATTTNVNKKVLFISAYSTIGLVLLAVASILTPLGLYDTYTSVSAPTTFMFMKDTSPIGTSTLNRDNYNISRLCGWLMYKPCPGQYHGFHSFTNDTGGYTDSDSPDDYISTVMPDNLTEIFSSGRDGNLNTVATPFDIQFRSYYSYRDVDTTSILLSNQSKTRWNIDQQRMRTVGSFKTYDSFMLDDAFVVRDGIVADMRKGGIGFRNHTVPANARVGTEWTENLLWIEPESLCINNNISLAFRSSLSADTYNLESYIVDNGALVEIQNGIQYPTYDYEHTQDNPQLFGRAFKGATLTNYNSALLLGVSSKHNASFIGRRWKLQRSTSYEAGIPEVGTFGLGIPGASLDDTYADPSQNISSKYVESIDLLVTGYGGIDVANISRVAANGGIIIGAPLVSDKSYLEPDTPGNNYTAPIYSCATVLKAYIMNVTFFINGTTDLGNLQVRNATPRSDADGPIPLWAIEKAPDQFFVEDIDPLWGLVDDKYENDSRFYTTRRQHLYLPAGVGSFRLGGLSASDSIAAGSPQNILSTLYSSTGGLSGQDYLGKYSRPLQQKWQNLSPSKDTVPTMLSLIWTNMAINTLTSRRSQLNAKFPSVTTTEQSAKQNVPDSVPVQVTYQEQALRYHMVYAIPGIIFLVFYILVVLVAITLRIMNRSTLTMLRSLLNQTSVGRAVLAERLEHDDTHASTRMKSMATKEWVDEYGVHSIGIDKDVKYKFLRQHYLRNNESKHGYRLSSVDVGSQRS